MSMRSRCAVDLSESTKMRSAESINTKRAMPYPRMHRFESCLQRSIACPKGRSAEVAERFLSLLDVQGGALELFWQLRDTALAPSYPPSWSERSLAPSWRSYSPKTSAKPPCAAARAQNGAQLTTHPHGTDTRRHFKFHRVFCTSSARRARSTIMSSMPVRVRALLMRRHPCTVGVPAALTNARRLKVEAQSHHRGSVSFDRPLLAPVGVPHLVRQLVARVPASPALIVRRPGLGGLLLLLRRRVVPAVPARRAIRRPLVAAHLRLPRVLRRRNLITPAPAQHALVCRGPILTPHKPLP